MNSPLQGRRILVTRPEAQSARLIAELESRGATVLALPLHRIEPWGDPELHRSTLGQSRHFDGWIFTSANAARRCAELDPVTAPWPALYAVGAATAGALEDCGRAGATFPPADSTSEALLDLAPLHQVRGRRFLLCTGVGGREVLATTLAARGAQVQRLELYRRVPIGHPAETLVSLLDQAEAVIITSGEGLQRFHELAPEESRARLLATLLVVPSARVLELARRLGFAAPLAPTEMSDAALVASLERALASATPAQ